MRCSRRYTTRAVTPPRVVFSILRATPSRPSGPFAAIQLCPPGAAPLFASRPAIPPKTYHSHHSSYTHNTCRSICAIIRQSTLTNCGDRHFLLESVKYDQEEPAASNWIHAPNAAPYENIPATASLGTAGTCTEMFEKSEIDVGSVHTGRMVLRPTTASRVRQT